MVEDLEDVRRQILAIRAGGEELLADLSHAQLLLQPQPGKWSIANCVDHLIVAGSDSVSNIRNAIKEARTRRLFSVGPFRYGLLERWFVSQMEPPPKMRMKAPEAYAPIGRHPDDLLPGFLLLQDQLLECIRESDGIDLSKVKVSNPISRLMRFSLGQEFALNAAHERRHLWQARRVKNSFEFFSSQIGAVFSFKFSDRNSGGGKT